MGTSAGKSNTWAVRVQALKPELISAAELSGITRMIELLPFCILPISHAFGATLRA